MRLFQRKYIHISLEMKMCIIFLHSFHKTINDNSKYVEYMR